MSDMSAVIIPKSDQLNADDLIAGPRTITITGVTIKSGEQPVSIHFDGDNGKPYKCCKSMARILVSAWGADSKQYVGRSVTLFRDPEVKWGGMAVGGIRISHMTNLDRTMTMALTETRGKRAMFTVKPLTVDPVKGDDEQSFVTAEQAGKLAELCKARGITEKFLTMAGVEKFEHVLSGDYAGGKKWIERQKVAPET